MGFSPLLICSSKIMGCSILSRLHQCHGQQTNEHKTANWIKSMNESEFNQQIDDLLIEIEDAIEESGVDIDYETVAGILTLDFENGSQVIINRQVAMRQLWIAARSGGFHLAWVEGQWVTSTTKESMSALIDRVCTEQSGELVNLGL